MSAEPLTIRNLTSSPVELKHLERYENHALLDQSRGFSNITRKLTGRSSNRSSRHSSPSSRKSSGDGNSSPSGFRHEDASVSIGPFQTSRTEIKTTEQGPHEVLRLVFEVNGQQYLLDTLPPTAASKSLVPLTADPSFNFTAVYHANQSHLSILSSSSLSSWMASLDDALPLSALSIPGTHNSPTYHHALPSVRCQAASLSEQLKNGIRFLDIRVQPEKKGETKDSLLLVHAAFPVALSGSKYFRDLVNKVEDFLAQNPSETIIMSIKREGTGSATDEALSRILRDHYAGDVHKWFTAPRIPTLGEARGKIVLVRRFALEDGLCSEWDGAGWCLDAQTWTYNTPHEICGSGRDFCVQDFCEVLETENIDEKIRVASELLDRASKCTCPPLSSSSASAEKIPFHLNFLSAANFWKPGCWPQKIAEKLNPAITEHLCLRHGCCDGPAEDGGGDGDGGTGIVVCDWVGFHDDWDLVRCIVAMNARLHVK
ncbi:MAG: hypothetical protein M1819_000230 [Sarea resinae]|nr:MAG: hypothetical protein M1819_000230 [Sarea resinae]